MDGEMTKEGLTAAVGGCSIWAFFLSWHIKCKMLRLKNKHTNRVPSKNGQYTLIELKTHLFSHTSVHTYTLHYTACSEITLVAGLRNKQGAESKRKCLTPDGGKPEVSSMEMGT